MNILYLSLTPSMQLDDASGYATHMREVMGGLAAAGHRVVASVANAGGMATLIAPAADAGAAALPPSAARLAGLKHYLPGGLRHLLRDLRELALDRRARARLPSLLRAHRIEAIYERSAVLQAAGLEVAAALGVPHLLEINTPLEERREHHGFPLYRVGVRRERRKLALADQVTCVSTELRRYLHHTWGLAPERVEVIPNAARPERYRLSGADRQRQRAALGIGEADIALGFVGRFGFWHGMPALVTALTEVLRAAPRARAVLIGDGQLMPEVRARVAGSGLGDRFTLTGSVDWRAVPAHVAALDVGIMASSNWYGSPLKIFEYGAAGVCVVGPQVPPVAEVLADGADGVLVPPGDAPALARALIGLVADDARRRALALHFQRRVCERYSWARVAARIVQLLAASPRGRRAAGGSACASS